MSTFYATFNNVRQARGVVRELLRGGILSDDISLVANDSAVDRTDLGGIEDRGAMREEAHSVGDATAFVGRDDDPRQDDLVPPSDGMTNFTSVRGAEETMGIDTSYIPNDVESVDQNDDGQEYVDSTTYSAESVITQSEHERDDINLTLLTGYPTAIPLIDDIQDRVTPLQDQNDDSLESLVVPGFGIVMGGGALATAALDFINPESTSDASSLVSHLRDEGVPAEQAKAYRHAFESGKAIIAVNITPGEVNEQAVEEIAGRHGAQLGALYDAPRFYNNGGQKPKGELR